MRDLSRARGAAVSDLRRVRQHLLSFLLRRGRFFEGRSHRSKAHRHWLAGQRFDHRAQQIALPGSSAISVFPMRVRYSIK